MKGRIIKRGKLGKEHYTIVLQLGLDQATGKRKQQWIAVQGNKRDAEKRLTDLIHQLDTGTFVRPGKTTLAQYLETWLSEYCWPNLAPRTAEGYQYVIRHYIMPTLGNIPLTALKPEHLQKLYADRFAIGGSNRTVQYIHATLHKSLDSAMRLGLISRNVADSVDRPKTKPHQMHVMNEVDMFRFLELSKDTPYFSLWYTALFTGMRRSELLALRWSDIDLVMNQISVNRTIHQLKTREIVFQSPKTVKGKRLIALSPSAAIVLREYRQQQETIRTATGSALSESDLVFNQNGKPLSPDSITHAWEKAAARAGTMGVRLHDARHTHASLLLKQGVHPKVVQERLGHASIQITLDTYSHVAPGLQEAAAVGFDRVVSARELVAN